MEWSALGKLRHEWNMFADLMAVVANCNRNPEKTPTPYRREHFHPLPDKKVTTGRGIPLTRESLHALKPLLKKR